MPTMQRGGVPVPSVTVELPCIDNLTGNHSHVKGKGRMAGRMVLRREVRDWQVKCSLVVMCELGRCPYWDDVHTPTELRVRIDQHTNRRVDDDNRAKPVWDMLKLATGLDDKHYKPVPGKFIMTPAAQASLVITLEWDTK